MLIHFQCLFVLFFLDVLLHNAFTFMTEETFSGGVKKNIDRCVGER